MTYSSTVREVGEDEICEREVFGGGCPLMMAEASAKGYNLDGGALIWVVHRRKELPCTGSS